VGLLGGEALERRLLGGGVDAHIEIIALEGGQLSREVGEGPEAVALDEVLVEVEERALDLALGPGAANLAGAQLEPVVTVSILLLASSWAEPTTGDDAAYGWSHFYRGNSATFQAESTPPSYTTWP